MPDYCREWTGTLERISVLHWQNAAELQAISRALANRRRRTAIQLRERIDRRLDELIYDPMSTGKIETPQPLFVSWPWAVAGLGAILGGIAHGAGTQIWHAAWECLESALR